MRTIQDVEWDTPPLVEPHRNRELERFVRQELGAFPSTMRYLSAVPWLVHAQIALTTGRLAHLSQELAELAEMVVSRDNSCRLCYAGSRVLLRITGVSDERIEKLEESLFRAELDSRDKLGLEFVRRISHSNPLASAEDKKLLRWPFRGGTAPYPRTSAARSPVRPRARADLGLHPGGSRRLPAGCTGPRTPPYTPAAARTRRVQWQVCWSSSTQCR